AVGRHRRQDRPLRGEVLEDLAAEDSVPPTARFGDQQEERLGVALQLERAPAGCVRQELEPVAQVERLRPLPIGRTEVAEEAGDDVEPGLRERAQERPRVAFAEEAARVRDSEALAAAVLEPREVV